MFELAMSFFLMAVATCFSLSMLANGLVDDSRPDLSMFKLRPVDARQLARSRLGKPIADLATGAIHMHESLFVEAHNVKCPAYAHLFKLIKKQQQQQQQQRNVYDDDTMAIRQDLVATLAIVVTYDRILYHELFLRDLTEVSVANFVEAIRSLERLEKFEGGGGGSHKATWLDLMQCLSSYMRSSEVVSRLLEDRQNDYRTLSEFMSIPITRAPMDNDGAPEALVRNLANRYEQGIHKRASLGSVELHKSAEQIESLEDEPMLAMRRQIKAEWAAPEGQIAHGHGATEAAAAFHHASGRPEDGAADLKNPDPEMDHGSLGTTERPVVGAGQLPGGELSVELVVPTDFGGFSDKQVGDDAGHHEGQPQPEVEKQEKNGPDTSGSPHPVVAPAATASRFHEAQMAILKFIKMRLEQRPTERFERAPRLSMQLAMDFISHWDDLRAVEAQGGLAEGGKGSFASHALAFLGEPNNVRLAERVRFALEVYVEMTGVLGAMKQHEDRYRSIEELRLPLERLTELLNSMDGSFDVDDIRRLHSIWQSKYAEYSTMDKFINSDSW